MTIIRQISRVIKITALLAGVILVNGQVSTAGPDLRQQLNKPSSDWIFNPTTSHYHKSNTGGYLVQRRLCSVLRHINP